MPDITVKLKKIEDCLKEKLKKEGILPRYNTTLSKLWQDYLYSQEKGYISGDEKGWAAALYYILYNIIIKEKKNQGECAAVFNISRGNLGRKYREIKGVINLKDYQIRENSLQEETIKYKKDNIISTKKKNKFIIENKPDSDQLLTDEVFKELFIQMKELIKLLHQEKEYFEIKKYLKFIEINLKMSGYNLDYYYLEEKFGKLFPKLKMIPKKGRQAEKFVHLYDNYGQAESFVLIKL